jgi:DUF1365 family protein
VTPASAIYEGRVAHRRFGRSEHRLSYAVWYLLADLDELDDLDRDVSGFANEGRVRVSFHARDHGPRDGSPLRPWIEAQLDRAGVDLEGGPVRLLSFPRILGYAFNPISVWFCHGPLGDLRALLFEVSNTFGEWHHYLVPVDTGVGLRADGRQVVRTRFDKELFVSPFIEMQAVYDIVTRVPDDAISLVVNVEDGKGPRLSASFAGTRVALTGRNLRRMLLRYPLLNLKVIGGIHWEAVKLWRKGAPYRRRGLPPIADLTILPMVTEPQEVRA